MIVSMVRKTNKCLIYIWEERRRWFDWFGLNEGKSRINPLVNYLMHRRVQKNSLHLTCLLIIQHLLKTGKIKFQCRTNVCNMILKWTREYTPFGIAIVRKQMVFAPNDHYSKMENSLWDTYLYIRTETETPFVLYW